MTAIRFRPQVEGLGANLRIELGKTAKEPLQDMPSRDGSQVCCIDSSGINDRIACEEGVSIVESKYDHANGLTI